MKGIKIEHPWWLPHACYYCKEQCFEDDMSDFITDKIEMRLKDAIVEIPWWLPQACYQAKEQGFEGNFDDFLFKLIEMRFKK